MFNIETALFSIINIISYVFNTTLNVVKDIIGIIPNALWFAFLIILVFYAVKNSMKSLFIAILIILIINFIF